MLNLIVSPEWLNKNFNDPDLVILDASQKVNLPGIKTEFSGLQIKGARFFDYENTFSDTESYLPHMLPTPEKFELECRKLGINNSSTIVVYDNVGIYTSPRVWWMFKTMGHENISVLDGGLPAWVSEGYETEQIINNDIEPGNFTANFNPANVKDLKFVKDNLENENAIIVDARSEGRFNGTEPEPREGITSGHIPKSVNIPFQGLINGDGKYKSKSELASIFNTHNFEDKPIVFSCGSGVTACIVMLASEMILNNPKSVFDGSWTEWAQVDGLPVVTQKD